MKYRSQGKQLTLDSFRSSLSSLPKTNRWVLMGDTLPWEEIEKRYNTKLNNGSTGAGNKPARMVVGALIIKHKMNLSDEETILAIQENPYMQYMLGLSEFTDKPVFHPSLFVTIRTRLQIADLNDFTSSLLSSAPKSKRTEHPSDDCNDGSEDDVHTDSKGLLHKGSMKVDATCSDAEVRFPTDVDLLEDGSRVINRYIDKLCDSFSLAILLHSGKRAVWPIWNLSRRRRSPRKGLTPVSLCFSHI